MKKNIYLLFVVLLSILFSSCGNKTTTIFPVIPQPNRVVFEEGNFSISDKMIVYTNLNDNRKVNLWLSDLPKFTIQNFDEGQISKGLNLILDTLDQLLIDNIEAYEMTITNSSISIRGKSEAGLYYGVQTLIQLYREYGNVIPAMSIVDAPRFEVRSLMLDASSFYIKPDFIKKQIDAMAHYKLNRLQWVLGGEGGWRIPISGYPQLTEQTAWRTVNNFQEMLMHGGEFCSQNSESAFGGYYSETEIKDILDYASARNITIVPSIDLPHAHHKLAQAANISFAEQEQKKIMQSILSSLIKLFPSEYIYVGNGLADDSYGTVCESCRNKVDTLKVLDESEPYRVVLNEADIYLASHGRKLLTWEESLRMGLSDSIAIVSWHNRENGVTAAKRGYNVILSPADVSSLSFYQSDPTQLPKAMSGFLPLEKVYAFNPIVTENTVEYINGIQVNMWTHMIDKEADIEYMLYPRLLAAAEVGWTQPVRKSFLDFKRRVSKTNELLRQKSYNCFNLSDEIATRPERVQPVNSLAKHKSVYYNSMFAAEFPANGVGSLTDGVCGGWHYTDGDWQGFVGEKMSVTIDLGEELPIRYISAAFISDIVGNVYLPSMVQIFTSNDGDHFEILDTIQKDLPIDLEGYHILDFGWTGDTTTRYIKYEALKNSRQVSWLFTDEIIIR